MSNPSLPRDKSIIAPLGYQSTSCGYCKSSANNGGSYYARTSRLTVDDYQKLIDRGWRRSGTILYKPDVYRSCCPHYTIRLAAADYKPSRDQRQCLNRWNRYVLGEKYAEEVVKSIPRTREQKKKDQNEFLLETKIHEPEFKSLKLQSADHRFTVDLESAEFSKEKFDLYKQYQINIHCDQAENITEETFNNFLCRSPLVTRAGPTVQGLRISYGSFHQCYRVDGRLVALGVIDLLPHAVSGVYFLYHPDFVNHSFGKLGAMREISLASEYGLQYYYFGYYIHNCVKMRYKGDYNPQQVLDPINYGWNMLDDVKPLMDENTFVSMNEHMRTKSGLSNAGQDKSPENAAKNQNRSKQQVWKYATAQEAYKSQESVLRFGLPGVPNAAELLAGYNLENTVLHLGRGMIVTAKALGLDCSIASLSSVTPSTLIGELVACTGPEVARDMIVDLSDIFDPDHNDEE